MGMLVFYFCFLWFVLFNFSCLWCSLYKEDNCCSVTQYHSVIAKKKSAVLLTFWVLPCKDNLLLVTKMFTLHDGYRCNYSQQNINKANSVPHHEEYMTRASGGCDIWMVQPVEISRQNAPYWRHLSRPRKATDKIQQPFIVKLSIVQEYKGQNLSQDRLLSTDGMLDVVEQQCFF